MHPQSPKRLDDFLETSLPDLLSSECGARWSENWVGQQLDVYRIEDLLGTGTHGVVFRARRTTPYEQIVAIKLLPNLRGQANAAQFQNECQALADLEHRNICQILNAGLTEDGTPYLVMPLLSGITIDRYVDDANVDDFQIARLVKQVAEAVAFAHERGVVHCDLKPDNIVVDKDGHVTVTDFGLAVRINQIDDLVEQPSWGPGTIGYAAPEILWCRKDASHAMDVYSLGAILHRLLTGKAPHETSDWLESLVSLAGSVSPPVQTLRPEIPEHLAAVCDQCLAPVPSQRIRSAEQVKKLLEQWISSNPPSSSGQREHTSLRPFRFGVLASVGLAITLAVVYSIRHSSYSNSPGREQPRTAVSNEFTSEEIELALKRIEEEWLQPGLQHPSQPGDFAEAFAKLQRATRELDILLASAPESKTVRHRTATAYFLLGRAAHWVHEDERARNSLAYAEWLFRELHREYPQDGFMFDFFHTIYAQTSAAPSRQQRDLYLMMLGIIEGLHEAHPMNLDYSDALACTLVSLGFSYADEVNSNLRNVEKAGDYAQRGLEMAEWTCDQAASRTIHRKQIMQALMVKSIVARLQNEHQQSMQFAKVAYAEAIRLDDAMRIADTKQHRFRKALRLAIAYQELGRIDDARELLTELERLLTILSELGWPRYHVLEQDLSEFKQSLPPLS